MTPFELFVICHIAGDYIFQNNWMALNKTKDSTSLLVHCTIYTTIMTTAFACYYNLSHLQTIGVYVVVFTSHHILDMFSVADKWLSLIRGRSFRSLMEMKENICDRNSPKAVSLYAGFTAVVYCLVDFFFHFVLSYPGILIISN